MWVLLLLLTRKTQHPDKVQGSGSLTPLDLNIVLLGMQTQLQELCPIILEADMMLVAK